MSVFGLVFVVFIALFAYRQVTHVELSTISQDKLEEKIKDKDSFVVVVGSDKDNTTLNYKNVCLKYLEKNHSDKIYYVKNNFFQRNDWYDSARSVIRHLSDGFGRAEFDNALQSSDWLCQSVRQLSVLPAL